MIPFAAWPKIWGHRGSSGTAPENTLIGFREARESGVVVVTMDVRLASDGAPILMHDERIDRTTNGSGLVADCTAAELKELDAGSWFLPQCAGEQVPTLDEALRLCASLDLRVALELHGGEALGEAVLDRLEQLWPVDRSLPLVSSAATEALVVCRRRHPDWPRGLVFNALGQNWRERIDAVEAVMLHGNARDPVLLLELVATAKPVYAFVVNDLKRARSLSALGIAGIVTGYPGQMAMQGVVPPPRYDLEVKRGL